MCGLCPDDVWVSPNGVMFGRPHVRKGVLCRMVERRASTNKTMKGMTKVSKLYKLLNAPSIC